MTSVIAHRGASATHRENTLGAFRAAKEQGADWVELDARRTADGLLVVHHDAHLADGRAIVELDGDALPDDVPMLIDALDACAGMGVNIEIKNLPDDPDYDETHQISEAVAALVLAGVVDPVLVTSFNMAAIDRIRAIDPSIPTGWLVFDIGNPAQVVERCTAHGHTSVNPFVAFVDPSFVRTAHDAGVAVNVWTVDDEARMEELVRAGVDGIITNVPELARSVVDRLAT